MANFHDMCDRLFLPSASRFLSVFVLLGCGDAITAQSTSDWITNKHLEFVGPKHRDLMHRSYTPKDAEADAYTIYGQKYKLYSRDTVKVSDVYEGTYDGHTGLWMEFLNYDDYQASSRLIYVPFDEMKDVEEEVRAREALNEKRAKTRRWELILKVVGYGVPGILVMALVFGWLLSCRYCGSWFARRNVGRTLLAETREDYWTTDYQPYSMGKKVRAKQTRIKRKYRYDYQCKKCGQSWSRNWTLTHG